MFGEQVQIDRRKFVTHASVSLAAASLGLAAIEHTSAVETSNDGEANDRILALRLQTATPLNEMRDYYCNVLELEQTRQTETELEFLAGRTRITFVKSEDASATPFYHFAFNIPENKVKAAHDWQAARGPLIPTPTYMQDRKFPPTVRHFRNWNAHSVFFWDPAGNIVEYIGRHTLDNAASGPFMSDDILCASEIAFIADDVPKMADAIERRFDLPQYLQGSAGFRAIGDEHGLLLVLKRGRTSGAAIKNPKTYDVFPVEATIRSAKSLAIPEFPYEIDGTT